MNRRTTILAAAATMVVVAIVAVLCVITGDREPLQTYSRDGVSIKYPQGWIRRDESRESAKITVFEVPQKDKNGWRRNLRIGIQDLDVQVALDEYTAMTLQEIKELIYDFKVLRSEEVSLSGRPAHRFVFTGSKGTLTFKSWQTFTIDHGKAYIVSYTAEKKGFSDNLAAKITESFHFN